MAKDPAFLFYPGDWLGGTMTFSRFLKGAYMDLLVAQFNSGPLSLEEIKTVLGSDYGQAWPALQKKFQQDRDGLFFNGRLELEKGKRQNYSASRSRNRKGRGKEEPIAGPPPRVIPDPVLFDLSFTDGARKEILETWIKYRETSDKPFKNQMEIESAFKELTNLSEDNLVIMADIVNKSISNGWKGLFEQKIRPNQSSYTRPNPRKLPTAEEHLKEQLK